MEELRRRGGREFDQARQREAAFAHGQQQQRQQRFEAGKAGRCCRIVALLLGRRVRGMVRGDDVHVGQCLPQARDQRFRAQRRVDLAPAAQTDGVVGGQEEVVGADLTGQVGDVAACGGDGGYFLRGADVGDVGPATGGAASGDHVGDGQFGADWRAVQVVIDRATAGKGAQALFVLSVNDDGYVGRRGAQMAIEQRPVVGQEAAGGRPQVDFESRDRAGQLRGQPDVLRSRPQVDAEVADGTLSGQRQLLVHAVCRCRRRIVVRHIQDGRDAAGQRRSRGG